MATHPAGTYDLLQCHVSTAVFKSGRIIFYDFFAELETVSDNDESTSALFIPFQELLYIKVVRSNNMIHVAVPNDYVLDWATENNFQHQLTDLSSDTNLENCSFPIALELTSSSSLQHFLENMAPLIAADRRSRSFSRISVSSFLPLCANLPSTEREENAGEVLRCQSTSGSQESSLSSIDTSKLNNGEEGNTTSSQQNTDINTTAAATLLSCIDQIEKTEKPMLRLRRQKSIPTSSASAAPSSINLTKRHNAIVYTSADSVVSSFKHTCCIPIVINNSRKNSSMTLPSESGKSGENDKNVQCTKTSTERHLCDSDNAITLQSKVPSPTSILANSKTHPYNFDDFVTLPGDADALPCQEKSDTPVGKCSPTGLVPKRKKTTKTQKKCPNTAPKRKSSFSQATHIRPTQTQLSHNLPVENIVMLTSSSKKRTSFSTKNESAANNLFYQSETKKKDAAQSVTSSEDAGKMMTECDQSRASSLSAASTPLFRRKVCSPKIKTASVERRNERRLKRAMLTLNRMSYYLTLLKESEEEAVHTSEEVVTALSFITYEERNLLVSSCGDGTTALWDHQREMKRTLSLAHHRDAVNDVVQLSKNTPFLLTASDDRTINIWDLRNSSTPLTTIAGFADGINKCIILPQGLGPSEYHTSHLIASGCDDGLVYIHNLANSLTEHVLVDSFQASVGSVHDLLFHQGAIVTGSEDYAIRSWNLPFQPDASSEQRLIESMDEFTNPVNHLAFIPDEVTLSPPPSPTDQMDAENSISPTGPPTWLLVASSEIAFGTDFYGSSGRFGKAVKTFQGHTDYIRGMHITAQGTLYTVSDDSTLIEWNLHSSEIIRQVKLHDSLVMSSSITEDKSVLATGTADGEIRTWALPFQTECMTQ